jgi:hypothetical protein
VVVLGGFLGVLLEHVGDRIEVEVRAQSMAAVTERLRIAPAALGADVLLRGAAELGFRDLLRDPTAARLVPRPAPADSTTTHTPDRSTTHTPDRSTTPTSDRDAAAEEARTP